MSYKPQCSYWATASGPRADCEALLRAMEEQDIIPTYLTGTIEFDEETDYASLQVPENYGTMEQWEEVDSVFARLAAEFPTLDFQVREHCEELFIPTRDMSFIKGVPQDTAWGRILEPDDEDEVTVAKCIAYLRDCGMDIAADALDARFGRK